MQGLNDYQNYLEKQLRCMILFTGSRGAPEPARERDHGPQVYDTIALAARNILYSIKTWFCLWPPQQFSVIWRWIPEAMTADTGAILTISYYNPHMVCVSIIIGPQYSSHTVLWPLLAGTGA